MLKSGSLPRSRPLCLIVERVTTSGRTRWMSPSYLWDFVIPSDLHRLKCSFSIRPDWPVAGGPCRIHSTCYAGTLSFICKRNQQSLEKSHRNHHWNGCIESNKDTCQISSAIAVPTSSFEPSTRLLVSRTNALREYFYSLSRCTSYPVIGYSWVYLSLYSLHENGSIN